MIVSRASPRSPCASYVSGLLARPAPDSSTAIHIVRVSFDFVDGDTRTPQPLDRTYNHHFGKPTTHYII